MVFITSSVIEKAAKKTITNKDNENKGFKNDKNRIDEFNEKRGKIQHKLSQS